MHIELSSFTASLSSLSLCAMACHRTGSRSNLINTTSLHSEGHLLPPPKLRCQVGKLHLVLRLTLLVVTGTCFLSFCIRISPLSCFVAHVSDDHDVKSTRYLHWGHGIDCPGKHCVHCGGLGHQESSLRCALEEAMSLNRTFVLPSHMCIANEHTNTRFLQHSDKVEGSSSQSPMEMLYDLALMSHTMPVILSSAKEWKHILERKDRLSIVQVEGIKTAELKRNTTLQEAHVLYRTPSKRAWFVECKNRHNKSAITLPYSFLPSMAARPLRAAADHMKTFLGDYDALHVRRGDKVNKVHKGKYSGEMRSMYAHLDRDTRPEAIMERIKLWIPAGRTLYIATDEMKTHYFDLLSSKYRVVRAENFSAILEPVVGNNYQLFMVERLVLVGAKTVVKTWKEEPGDLSLSDEAKKKPHRWEQPGTSS